MKKILLLCFAFCYAIGTAQTSQPTDQKHDYLLKVFSDYFSLERENIHVHFDKHVFTTNESVWFKGYVFHRKKNLPFFNTINIYAALLDQEGKILETQLLYGNIGSFTGHFKLNSKFKTGKYYLQFYTNWMNNFTEDESSVYEITVINQTAGGGSILSAAAGKPVIEINPEGGILLQGAVNNIGIRVYGCGYIPLPVTEAILTDDKGVALKKIPLNRLGYGKTDLPATAGAGYKIAVIFDGVKYEQHLPAPHARGVALDVNNYGIADNTLIKIRTNTQSVNTFKNNPLYLVVHQDDKAAIYDVDFSNQKTEQVILLPNTDFFAGTNTIRVLDKDLNQLAERVVYIYPKTMLNATFQKPVQKDDEIELKGLVSYPHMNLSVSILPENTISIENNRDIYGDLLIARYIKGNTPGKYFFETLSKGKHYELDLFLLNHKSKYEWHNIRSNPPSNNFTFDMGLNVKGTVAPSADNKYAKIRLFSNSTYIEELTDINDNNEFFFNNLIIPDSAHVNFTLLKKGATPKNLTVMPQVLNANRKFYKMYKPEPPCTATATPGAYEMPLIQDDAVELEEVLIEAKKLKYERSSGNQNLRGIKITDAEITYNTLLRFITNYGFIVNDNGVDISISTRARSSSINAAASTAAVYIDNIQVYDYSQLRIIRMDEIDEIYLNPTVLVPSIRNFSGVIKIYRKKEALLKRNDPTSIVFKNGFENVWPFENVTYNSTTDKGFVNFGIINWFPEVMANENGEFKFTIPVTGQKTVKILLEGFSADGRLISEIKTLQLN